MTPEQAKETAAVFVELIEQRKKLLEHGMKLRLEMHKAMEEGRRPTGYRADWIRRSATIMLSVLQEIARDFDLEHTDDRCSLADLMDVTATTMGLLKKENES